MQDQSVLLKLLWISLALALFLCHGKGLTSRCARNEPTVSQFQVGEGKFKVKVMNNCGTCPVIDIHVKCGRFPQSLVDPKLFRVSKSGNCLVNSGFPLPPFESFSFNYSHSTMYSLHPITWYFQCE